MRNALKSSALFALLTLAACTEDGTLDVWFAGCREVTARGECRVLATETSTLTFWLAGGSIEVLRDGELERTDVLDVHGGVRFQLPINQTPVSITVRRPAARWTLRVTASTEPEVLLSAERLRGQGDFTGARALLEPLRADADAVVRARVASQLARIAIARGEDATAIGALQESIKMNRAAGSVWSEIDDRCALAYLKRNHGDYEGASEALSGIGELVAAYPAGAIWAHYYRGYVALGTADLRRAEVWLTHARIDAERLDIERVGSAAAMMQVLTLRYLGRNEEAKVLLAELDSRLPKSPPCARADALEQIGRLAYELQDPRATPWLREAVELYRRACVKPRRLGASLVLLGATMLAAQQTNEAEVLLAESKAVQPEPGGVLFGGQLALEAKIAGARLDRSAEKKYRRLELHGSWLGDPLVEWEGLVGLGAALERAGRTAPAIDAYQRAENLLDTLRFNAPLGGGRETFLGDRGESASRLIDLLIRADRKQEALAAARRSRARVLSALSWSARIDAAPEQHRRAWYAAVTKYQQQRKSYEAAASDAWKLSEETLALKREERERRDTAARMLLDEALSSIGASIDDVLAPLSLEAKELILLYHPAPNGWVVFAIDGETITVDRLVSLDRPLDPVSARIERNERLRILGLHTIDFHALSWKGRPLIEAKIVRYSADVEEPSRAVRDRAALIVDPHGELRSSRREAALAQAQLTSIGWRVERLSGEAATWSAINASIRSGGMTFFQYSGHASFAGLDGWDSHLGLEENKLLTVGDILTLPAPPAFVVLSGCETGTTRAGSGLGLAQVFIVAGARWVVASTRPVKDSDASAIIAELDAPRVLSEGGDIALFLQAAQKKLLARDPSIDWAAFRVFVP